MGPVELCVGPAQILLPFCKEIFSLSFDEEPNYRKLKHFLVSILLEFNLLPDDNFDWSKFTKRPQLFSIKNDEESKIED